MAWWSSILGQGEGTDAGGAGGGGGGMGGMNMGSIMGMATKGNDKIVSSILGPGKMRRERILALTPEYEDIGSSIGPVSRSPGGAAMSRALMAETGKATHASGINDTSILDRQLRDADARASIAHDSAAIAKKIAMMAAGGAAGAAGGAGMGGSAGFSGMTAEGAGFTGAAPAASTVGGGASGALAGVGKEYLNNLGSGGKKWSPFDEDGNYRYV